MFSKHDSIQREQLFAITASNPMRNQKGFGMRSFRNPSVQSLFSVYIDIFGYSSL